MADKELRVNSLRIRFDRGVPEPTDAEIFKFMKTRMCLSSDKLLSMYKDQLELSVIIKFRKEEDMQNTIRNLPASMEFEYNKYQSTIVRLSTANAIIRYVRLFNLPPEVEDKDIAAVLSKFGNVTRLVREKYGEETGFPIWTSVRGAYLEIKDAVEIPATLHVKSMRARIFYEGLVNKCFLCGSKEHLKAECPQKRSVNERLQNFGQPSFSAAVKGDTRWIKQRAASEIASGSGDGMVKLGPVPPMRNATTQSVETVDADEEGAVGGESNDQANVDTTTTANTSSAMSGVAGVGSTTGEKADEFIMVTSKRSRKQTKEQKEGKTDTSDSDHSSTGADDHDSNAAVVVLPNGERLSEATDRCTRSKAKLMKLIKTGESSSSPVAQGSSEQQSTADIMDTIELDDKDL